MGKIKNALGKDPIEFLRGIYPGLTDEELKEADRNLEAYVEVVLRIYERIRSDPEAYEKFKEAVAAEKREAGKNKG